jgi:hypothetical protein
MEILDARERPEEPTQTKNGLARCFCGVDITNRSLDAHIRAFHRASGPEGNQPPTL